jgi:DNA-binding IclR family transcriptional regulator
VDDQENEPGIVCVAVPAFLASPTVPTGAVSVSAPAYRTPLSRLVAAAEEIRRLVAGG